MARYFGYRPEQTYGVENIGADITYLEMGKCNLDPPKSPNLDIPTIEETESRIKRGLYAPEGDLEIALDIPTMINFLYMAFGTQIITDNLYEMYPLASRHVKSFTAYVGKDDGNPNDYEHVFYGAAISKLSITLSDGIATATMSLVCQRDGKATLKTESQIDIADTYPLAFYEADTMMGSTDLTARTVSFEWEFNNNISANSGQAFGSMHPYRLISSGKDSTIKSDVFYEGYDFLVKFWGGQNGPTCNTTYENYKIKFTDELGNTLTLYFPKIAIDRAAAPIEGSDEIKQSLELKVLKGKTALNSGDNIRTSVLATVELADD
ncbi:phage tail tube protein [Methanobrevibacter sp.]|uniref:phage tail tube protein n=1 Tax=Methanobrevibacter sp. TaxID=66852 RepID=UPI003890EDFD